MAITKHRRRSNGCQNTGGGEPPRLSFCVSSEVYFFDLNLNGMVIQVSAGPVDFTPGEKRD
jgi:hypothetical protein